MSGIGARRLILIGVILGFGLAAGVRGDGQAPSAEPRVLVLRVYFADRAERDRLAVMLDADDHVGTLGGYLTVFADEARYEELRGRGLKLEIDKAATAAANQPVVWSRYYGGYRTVEETEAFLAEREAANPMLAQRVDIGDSWCKTHAPCQLANPSLAWDGHDLWAMRITNREIAGPKPVFWFDTGIHSREIAAPEVAMRFIDWLLDGYWTVADARWLVDHHEIWVMPMVNPDGYRMVQSGAESPAYQRKNADYDDGCTVWGSGNQLGTDLNRNFPFLWSCCTGSSGLSCNPAYRGPSKGSEEETLAVMGMIRSLIPDQRGPAVTDRAPLTATGIIQTMHSYGEFNLYPWGWTEEGAPNSADLRNIALHMGATDAGGNGYIACQAPNCLYNVDGSEIDWAYGELGVASVSTELEGGSFFPSFGSVDAIWNNNRRMLTYLARIARAPYLLARGPDANSVATNPESVYVWGKPQSELTATIRYAWAGNSYLQNVAGAEYYVDTPPWAGGTPNAMAPSDGAFNSPTEVVRATIDTSDLTPGWHVVLVRGRGVNSYQGSPSWGPISAAWLKILDTPGPPSR